MLSGDEGRTSETGRPYHLVPVVSLSSLSEGGVVDAGVSLRPFFDAQASNSLHPPTAGVVCGPVGLTYRVIRGRGR